MTISGGMPLTEEYFTGCRVVRGPSDHQRVPLPEVWKSLRKLVGRQTCAVYQFSTPEGEQDSSKMSEQLYCMGCKVTRGPADEFYLTNMWRSWKLASGQFRTAQKLSTPEDEPDSGRMCEQPVPAPTLAAGVAEEVCVAGELADAMSTQDDAPATATQDVALA